MFDAEACGGRERLERGVRRRGTLRFEKRLRPAVGGAGQMKPQRHLALAKCIRLPFAEAQIALGDRLIAAATFGAAARCRFDEVWHARIICRLHELLGALLAALLGFSTPPPSSFQQ